MITDSKPPPSVRRAKPGLRAGATGMEQRPEQGQLTEMVLEGHGLLSLINGDTHVDTKRGRILNLTSSGEACTAAGPTNSETRSHHLGRSEHENS